MTQMMTRNTLNKRARVALPLVGLGALAAVLSGCGGATSGGGASIATPDSGPVVYGINALALSSGATTQGETSGIAFNASSTDAKGNVTTTPTGVFVGAFAYKTVAGAGPLPAYQAAFPNSGPTTAGIPLGFTPSGSSFYYGSSAGVAALPTNYAGALTFGVYASQGARGGNLVPINPSSIVLTSPEAPSFSLPLTFDPTFGSGVLAQTQYKGTTTGVPAFLQTTGLHDLRATIADTAGQSSTTDFAVASVAPTDVALALPSITVLTPATATAAAALTNTPIAAGDTVTIDGGAGIGVYPTGYTGTLADAQGTVVLFTTPGTHTLTETTSKGTVVQTETFTLAATTAGTTLLGPPTPDGAPTGAIVKKVVRARRLIKH